MPLPNARPLRRARPCCFRVPIRSCPCPCSLPWSRRRISSDRAQGGRTRQTGPLLGGPFSLVRISMAGTASSNGNADSCIDEVRRRDHDRFLTALLAPADRRAALFALYAFNAEIARVREAVSEPMLGQIRLQWWRETVEALTRGEVRGHEAAAALAETGAAAALPAE